jgi:hypothetical protein
MKKSTQLQIIAILILIVIAIVDAFPFTPVAAISAIALLLFRPKWLFRFFEKLYDEEAV